MTPAARVAAVMEVLGVALPGSLPAEQVLAAYLRRRRYIGSKDRRAITQRFYSLLRSLSRLDWWLEAAGQSPSQVPGQTPSPHFPISVFANPESGSGAHQTAQTTQTVSGHPSALPVQLLL